MRVCLHLHPDWPARAGTVAEALARDGVYLSQFATGTSNGGLTAHQGGDRWRWESRLFEGRYDDADPRARPVYGALHDRPDPYGPSPRFGSAHLRLRPEVASRATLCFPDSHLRPERTWPAVDADRVAALRDAAAAADPAADSLDDYVEAHVHGGVRLADDVEAVVLDPCFRGGEVEDAVARWGCAVEWHPGYRLGTADVPDGSRGPEPAALARRLGEVITPADLGAAARAGAHDPQTLKRVWHLMARFGRRPGHARPAPQAAP